MVSASSPSAPSLVLGPDSLAGTDELGPAILGGAESRAREVGRADADGRTDRAETDEDCQIISYKHCKVQ